MIDKFGNNKCKEIFDLECPFCHEHLNCNKRTYANHLRWCKSNPKYEEILASTKKKVSKNNGNKVNKKVYTFVCEVCGKEYQLELSENSYNKGKYKKTCSVECSKKLTAQHTNKTKKNEKISEKFEEKRKNRQKVYCKNCGTVLKSCNKKFCSLSCKNEYIKNHKELNKHKTLENLLKQGKILQAYKKSCSFDFSLNSFPFEFDFSLIEKYGWYKAKNKGNNLSGIVRDHKISKQYGFDNLIDPYIISHPANCKLMQQTENQKKHINCSLTINELLNNIYNWNKIYGEYQNKIDYSVFEKYNIKFKIKYMGRVV